MATTHDIELAIRAMLAQTSVLAVVISQLEHFKESTGHKPEIISLNNNLQMAFIVDIIRCGAFTPAEAVQTPIWIDGIPLVYSDTMGDCYLKLTNKRIKAINKI